MTSVKTIAIALILIGTISCNDQQSDVAESSSADTAMTSAAPDSTATAPVSDTVNVPAVVAPESDGSLLLTAQKGKGLGPKIKYMPEWRAFGWFTSADSIQWDVDVKDAGSYDVMLEWSVSDEEAGKEFLLRAGKDELTGKVDKSGSWETYKTKNVGDIKLDAGPQTVVFKSKKAFKADGALLDLRQIKLVKK